MTNRSPWLWILLTSLLLGGSRARASEQLEVRLDGLSIPLELRQLEAWSRNPAGSRTELAIWLELLDEASRRDLRALLRTPLLPDRDLALQLLQSWAGRQVLEEVGEVLGTNGSGSGLLLLSTLRELLQGEEPFSVLDLLLAVPAPRLTLDLDALTQLAGRWRQQLEDQAFALRRLRSLGLPGQAGAGIGRSLAALAPPPHPRPLRLTVAHRDEPLDLQLWPGDNPRQRSWVLLMPGLGGSGAQLAWLARGLAERGWSVLVVEHPDSDEAAVRQLLDGRRAPPGAETLPGRLADVEAVLRAERSGALPPLGESVVLMGHSLGGLSALLASGLRPSPGLEQRCDRALDGIPLTNLSRLLQCQLTEVPLQAPSASDPVGRLQAVVSLNGFGSLLWPSGALEHLPAPMLLVGGSLDLVTPPVSEQLGLFLQHRDPRSRLVVVDGGSHFSAVRMVGPQTPLLQLGDGLVGVEPLKVQELLLDLIGAFLFGLETDGRLPAQQRLRQGVMAYVLDRPSALRWSRELRH